MSGNASYTRKTCRLCESASLELVLPLGKTPIADSFVSGEKRSTPQALFPLDLMLCSQCGQCQLGEVVDPVEVYKNYVYVSTTTLGLFDHFRQSAETVIQFASLKPGSLVIDLGSNDGSILSHFKALGMNVLGVEPATRIGAEANAKGIPTLVDFFSSQLSKKILKEHGKANAITMNNLIANIDDLSDVITGVHNLLDDNGVFVFETSYLVDFVDYLVFDSAYHEHLSYFAVRPLELFFQKHGMRLVHVDRLSTKGGSIRGFAQKANGKIKSGSSVQELIDLEMKRGFHKAGPIYKNFQDTIAAAKKASLEVLGVLKAQGKVVAGYGASHTTTTLIYTFGLQRLIDFIIDENPAKFNTFSPGAHIPVISRDELKNRNPDAIYLFAWRYAEAIMKKNKSYLENGGTFLLPLPQFKTFS